MNQEEADQDVADEVSEEAEFGRSCSNTLWTKSLM